MRSRSAFELTARCVAQCKQPIVNGAVMRSSMIHHDIGKSSVLKRRCIAMRLHTDMLPCMLMNRRWEERESCFILLFQAQY
ncbi:MAG: hypothetical protein DWQ08_03960 [Proteobacteria bacterium]|nr:MAG: hypothetical protein DWQ08_03960 [Pseudomonadota bacterium]